jgi:hypothetical protein
VPKPSNRSFDTDTQRHCAGSRARKHTSRGAMPLRAGQLQRLALMSKIRRFTQLAALLLVCLQLPVADAQQFWDRTRDGMSLQTIRKTFPKAEDNPRPESLLDGSRDLVHLRDAKLGGHPFHARFYFFEDQLVQARLISQGPSAQTQPAHAGASATLRARYGPPIYAGSDSFTGGSSRKDTWKSGATRIDLHMDCVALPGADNCLVLVNYRSRELKGGLWKCFKIVC